MMAERTCEPCESLSCWDCWGGVLGARDTDTCPCEHQDDDGRDLCVRPADRDVRWDLSGRPAWPFTGRRKQGSVTLMTTTKHATDTRLLDMAMALDAIHKWLVLTGQPLPGDLHISTHTIAEAPDEWVLDLHCTGPGPTGVEQAAALAHALGMVKHTSSPLGPMEHHRWSGRNAATTTPITITALTPKD